MMTKIMNFKKINILLTAVFLLMLTGCVPDPADYTLKTSDEILIYMNKKFPAKFTKVPGGVEVNDKDSFPKSITVKFTTDITGDEIITVRHEFAQDNMFGFVNEYFETDFYCIYYFDKVEEYAEKMFRSYLDGKYDYKLFYELRKSITHDCEDADMSFDEYMSKSWNLGSITAVIKGSLNTDPVQDKSYYSLLGKLEKERMFSSYFYFLPDVDLETVTLESLLQNSGE